jgi:hypothetical protein
MTTLIDRLALTKLNHRLCWEAAEEIMRLQETVLMLGDEVNALNERISELHAIIQLLRGEQ